VTTPNPFLPGPSIDDEKPSQGFDDYRWSQMEARLDKHQRSLVNLTERLTALEVAFEQLRPATKPRDDLSERIAAFLEAHPDLKFTAISIDENLDATGKDLSDRCKNLARNGRIRMFAEPNRRPFYQALPPTPPEV
jgi:hypothetical protein